MADAANASETDDQVVDIGLIVISRATIFSSDVRKWHDKPRDDRTLTNFKIHFKEAQKAIKRSQPAMTPDSLGFHGQVNAATQVLANDAAQRNSDAAALQLATQQAQQATQTQMLEQIYLLMSTAIQAANTNTNNQTQRNNGGGSNRGNGRSTGRGK